MSPAEAQLILAAIPMVEALGLDVFNGFKALVTKQYGVDSWPALVAQCQTNVETERARLAALGASVGS